LAKRAAGRCKLRARLRRLRRDKAASEEAQRRAKRRASRTSAARSPLLRTQTTTPTRGAQPARSDSGAAAAASERRRGAKLSPSSRSDAATSAGAAAASTPRRCTYEAPVSGARQPTGARPARSMASQRAHGGVRHERDVLRAVPAAQARSAAAAGAAGAACRCRARQQRGTAAERRCDGASVTHTPRGARLTRGTHGRPPDGAARRCEGEARRVMTCHCKPMIMPHAEAPS
jgi:hypothetical protein